MTHGIFGAGSNWRGIARKLVDRRREWGVVLVDLRLHGRSDAGAPPHTVAACASDLAALIAELGDVRALAGHSFGGKTALATRALIELPQTWMLDASPSARPGAMRDGNSVVAVLELMERLPPTFANRDDFATAVIDAGHGNALAQWLAMNLVERDGVYVNRLDLAGIRALLEDYFALDLWDAAFAPRGDLEVVIADHSSALSPADRARLADAPGHVHSHVVDGNHWLHIEAADEVLELFATQLR